MKKRDIDFLFEAGGLRRVPRAWQQVMSSKVQNISEHTYRTSLIAWMIAVAEGANVFKVLKICLLHDIPESRTTDIAFLHRDYVKRDEELAIEDVFKDTALEKEAQTILEEYAERKTLEAQIVKDADNLDVDLELKELSRIGDSAAEGMRTHHRPIVRNVKLYTETAKKMWDAIQDTDPNAWHQTLTDKWIENKDAAK